MDLNLFWGCLTAFGFPIALAIASACEGMMKPKL